MWMLIARKQQIILMFIYGISMMINIILNIMFIPTYGTTAAAWITVISEGIVLIMSGFVVWRLVIKDNRE
jgi:O-antigen/teichoic acid export membrane protein